MTLRDLYPSIAPYATEMLRVSDLHTLYIEQCGNPKGIPVVFLHGGPGTGVSEDHRRFFDPKKWRVVLFDQRGCGSSIPHAEIRENTTWDLVSDIDTIRKHLGIERWSVFGGSWGSTLALAYAQKFPQLCTALFLRGIFLMRRKEIDWFYREGTSRLFPDLWEAYTKYVKHVAPSEYVEEYYRLLTDHDPHVRLAAAKAWSVWEGSTAKLNFDPASIASSSDDHFALQVARLECHYMIHGGWFHPDDQLLRDAHKMAHIPGVIVHGRYDVICPVENAWDLHKVWPKAELHIVAGAGHSAMEPGIRDQIISATDRFAASIL